jgi:hypothetical protein
MRQDFKPAPVALMISVAALAGSAGMAGVLVLEEASW